MTDSRTDGLKVLRTRIDRIDTRLTELLNERARVAIEIGQAKRRSGVPVISPERESEVIARAQVANNGPLSAEAVARIFHAIIGASAALE